MAVKSKRAPRALPPEHVRILDAAERIFAERGYGDTRMQDIASDARTSLRNVYGLATGKAEIFRMLHEERAVDLLSQADAVLSDTTRDPREALMDVIEVVVGFLMEHTDFLRIQLRHGLAWSLRDPSHPLDEARRKADRRLESLFRRGIKQGVFLDEGPRTMVSSLRAIEQVHLAAWLESRKHASKRVVTERIQSQARRLFVR